MDNLPQRLAEWKHISELAIAVVIDLGNRATAGDFEKLVASISSKLSDDHECFDQLSAIAQTAVAQRAEGTTEQASIMDKITNALREQLHKFLTASASSKPLDLLRNVRSIVFFPEQGKKGRRFNRGLRHLGANASIAVSTFLQLGPTSSARAIADWDLASLRRCLGKLASLTDVLSKHSPKTVPMELFVEEITDCLKEVHKVLVKQRLSELNAAGDAMSRHIGGAGGKH